MSYLKLNNLTKRFDDFLAVDGVNLTVSKGEFISLLGPSGCGKTTTLQMVAGFLEPTEGQIILDGEDITAKKPNERGLGLVFQRYALFPHMTVTENVAFGLEMRKISKEERMERAKKELELVHLGRFADRYPRHLSGGQQQRVALARALVIKPHLLLLDEPLSNLDAKLREEMQIELHEIQRRAGTTTILVTHDQSEALALSDRVVVLQDGKIEQVDEPYKIYEYPKSEFVSSFVGKANELKGTVNNGQIKINENVFSIGTQDAKENDQVTLVIRPEKIRFTNDNAKLKGKVFNRIFIGSQWIYEVDTPVGNFLVYETNNHHSEGVEEGQQVGMTWAGADIRLIQQGGQ